MINERRLAEDMFKAGKRVALLEAAEVAEKQGSVGCDKWINIELAKKLRQMVQEF